MRGKAWEGGEVEYHRLSHRGHLQTVVPLLHLFQRSQGSLPVGVWRWGKEERRGEGRRKKERRGEERKRWGVDFRI